MSKLFLIKKFSWTKKDKFKEENNGKESDKLSSLLKLKIVVECAQMFLRILKLKLIKGVI